MAFTFDATVSGPASNSYVTVAEANDYFAAHLEASYWPTKDTDKQAALVMATNRIDMESFGGSVTDGEQSLQWPRQFIMRRGTTDDTQYTASGTYYRDSATIPQEVKKATFEQALHYLKMSAGEFTVDENDLETLTKYKIGPLDVSIAPNMKADRLPSKVKNLLQATGPNAWNGENPLTYVR